MLRTPADQLLGARDIELVVRVGLIDHPRLHKRVLVEHVFLHPLAALRQCLRNFARLPVLVMYQSAKALLQIAIAERLCLADQQRDFVGQRRAPVDHAQHRIDHVVNVQVRLPGT